MPVPRACIHSTRTDPRPELDNELRRVALTVHNALGLKAYSRSDYIVDEKGDVYFLEINTLPGMTPTSVRGIGAMMTRGVT